MQSNPLVTLKNTAKFYGDRLIFKNVNLSIQAGETCLLTGDNGAGKTTFLRLLARLISPDAGHINHADNLSMAFLGHETCLYPALTALENLEFWSSLTGNALKKNRLLEALEEMNLLPFANEQCRHFSRGMAQRLNFARVLLGNPSLMLLDEPFTGMDAKSRSLVGAKLSGCVKNGVAMIISSHFPQQDAVFAEYKIHIENRGLKKASITGQPNPS